MITYSRIVIIIFFIILALFDFLLMKKEVGIKKIIMFTSFAMAVFWGIRSPLVGTDTQQYIFRFENNIIGFDILFECLSVMLNYITFKNSVIYLIIISLIINLLTGIAIYKIERSYKAIIIFLLTSIFPYYILSNINILRQGMAMSLFLFGIALFYNNESNMKGYLFFLFSILCHKMFVFPIICFIIINKYKLNIFYLLVVSFVLLLFLQNDIINIILLNFRSNPYIQKILVREMEIGFSHILKLLFYYGILIFNLFIKHRFAQEKSYSIIEYACTSFIISGSLFSMSPLYSSRFWICIDFFIPLMLYQLFESNCVFKFKKKQIYILTILFIILYCFFSTYLPALRTDLLL